MNSDENIISSAEMVSRVFSNIDKSTLENSNRITTAWTRILQSIQARNPETGKNLAAHSRIIDLKNGILLVEADHPGWIELLQLYKTYILNGLHHSVPQLTINSLAFRLKGSKAELSSPVIDPAKERQKMQENLDKEEDELKKRGFSTPRAANSDKKRDLPPKLQNLFEQFKNDMLTNSK